MLRCMLLFFIIVSVQAQQNLDVLKSRAAFKFDLLYGFNSIRNQSEEVPDFIEPPKSLLKLQRQLDMQFLPPDFYPLVETETNDFNKRALRYAVAYYRDCEIPGLDGFFDVMLPMRFDSRGGVLKVTYYRNATIINPIKVQIAEDRPSFAVITSNQVSALLLLLEGTRQQLFSFEGLFTENPKAVAFLSTDDVDGIKADLSVDKFAIFVRGGAARASLFVLNADVSLRDMKTYEVLKDLASTDRAYIFTILPALVPNYRAVPIP
ncbi:MAG: hypothetical protein RMM17_05870 [Acidobacteriota bacterium]|nr:hypothetical protein [Blastocatellia bacterium]MDW8412194.1 hypothetical protein [Acidobacteriota bacterium]